MSAWEPDLLCTLAEEVGSKRDRERWTQTDELLATLIELTSLARIEALALGGVKQSNLPGPLRMRRPGQPEPTKEGNTMSIGKFARRMVGR